MLIQEAIKSGKPFKQIFSKEWLCVGNDGTIVKLHWGSLHCWLDEVPLTIDRVLADNWEIKQT
jgi:hypothetical protein